jgi:delta-1-pyrroline-5-carboxylate synthetase
MAPNPADLVKRQCISSQESLRKSTWKQRRDVLACWADAINAQRESIERSNREDVARHPDNSERMVWSDAVHTSVTRGLRHLATRNDPLDVVLEERNLSESVATDGSDDTLLLQKVTRPFGRILIIFESRPDAYVQLAALCIATGNSSVLKYGHEANCTVQTLHMLLLQCLVGNMLDFWTVQIFPDRDTFWTLLAEKPATFDLVIPRGSKQLVQRVQDVSPIPVLGHSEGVCCIYVAASASLDAATRIIRDGKTSRPSACNSVEVVLVDQNFPHAKEMALALIAANITLKPQPPNTTQWTEHGTTDLTLVTNIDNVEHAIGMINANGSHHTDVIITTNAEEATTFQRGIDSACVFINASPRFSDGYRFGMGAEVGISTGNLHARGPFGIDGLLTHSWCLTSRHPLGHITH